MAQEEKPKYDRKEEIIHDGKLYRIHNNYFTFGPGFLGSTLRDDVQKAIGFDFNFHIRRNYFQVGFLMSGKEFLGNSNSQVHIGYGLRKENSKNNFAVYGGLSYFAGVYGIPDTGGVYIPVYYQGLGLYTTGQVIFKLKYDIGIGMEIFGEYNPGQSILGMKFVMFFSSAYKGYKKNFNPNVRSENKK